MHISLTPELENAVKARVRSGLYNNASEVVREALRQSLSREAAIGFAQLESGQTVQVDSKEQFMVEAYRREEVSLSRAAELAGLGTWEFLELMGPEKLELHYDVAEFEDDLRALP